jgi:hypothetical protein
MARALAVPFFHTVLVTDKRPGTDRRRCRGSRDPPSISPGWKAETDRVREGISEGFRLAESRRVVSGGVKAVSCWLLGIREFESADNVEASVCG